MGIKHNLAVVLLLGLAAADDQPGGLLNALESVVTANASPVHNGIESLLSQANSLIKSQYPSTTVTDLASLTWPTTVVIGGQTYTIPATETSLSTSDSISPSSAIASTTENARPILTSTASTTIPSATSTSSSQSSHTHMSGDKRLGIILGVVLGLIAVTIAAFLIFLLHRRRKNTGTFFKRRPSSPSDSEVSSWRNNGEAEKYGNSNAPPLLEPQMAAHDPYATRSWTNDDDDMNLGYHGYRLDEHSGPAELSAERSERGSFHRTISSENAYPRDRQDRPPTPFSPESFAAMAASPVSPIEQGPQRHGSSGFWPSRGSSEGYRPAHVTHQPSLAALAGSVAQDYPHPYYQNPFASHEDYDEDEYESPYHHNGPLTPDIPSRSPRRQSTPMVYYPSTDELGKFNFGTEDGRQRRPSELGA
ncbi:hypothetical protein E4T50_07257 [Aureobasidium sp. EXF-12298]|nr:hypothetical protein E4T50_07257 [Aureobasidium sp. EXF-12298]KAI4763839.1 hypothetical protein E4T51_03171 [Aureobasidium sp. EXF-12344]KAI4780846.1 hypothetical protein E4T52_04245 [Aureobasidium sp. EXF-3400]